MRSRYSANPMSKGGGGSGRDGSGGSKVIFRPDGSFYFEIDLIPGETTTVSWTKLLNDHAPEIATGASFASSPNAAASGKIPDLNAPYSFSTTVGSRNHGRLEGVTSKPRILKNEQSVQEKGKSIVEGSDRLGHDANLTKHDRPRKKSRKPTPLGQKYTYDQSVVLALECQKKKFN